MNNRLDVISRSSSSNDFDSLIDANSSSSKRIDANSSSSKRSRRTSEVTCQDLSVMEFVDNDDNLASFLWANRKLITKDCNIEFRCESQGKHIITIRCNRDNADFGSRINQDLTDLLVEAIPGERQSHNKTFKKKYRSEEIRESGDIQTALGTLISSINAKGEAVKNPIKSKYIAMELISQLTKTFNIEKVDNALDTYIVDALRSLLDKTTQQGSRPDELQSHTSVIVGWIQLFTARIMRVFPRVERKQRTSCRLHSRRVNG